MIYELYKLIEGKPTRFKNPANLTGDRTSLATEQGYKPKKVEYVDKVVDKYVETEEYLICYLQNPTAEDSFSSFVYETYLRANLGANLFIVAPYSFLLIRCLDNRTYKSAFETLVGLLATSDITETNYNICIAGLAEQGLHLSDYITNGTDE